MSAARGDAVGTHRDGDPGPRADRGGRALDVLRRAPGLLLVGAVRAYQRVVSPFLGPRCRFYPSCSQYAVVAIQRHGVLRGVGLAGWRLLRCNPWNDGGVDDVPPARGQDAHEHLPSHQH